MNLFPSLPSNIVSRARKGVRGGGELYDVYDGNVFFNFGQGVGGD